MFKFYLILDLTEMVQKTQHAEFPRASPHHTADMEGVSNRRCGKPFADINQHNAT